MFIYVLLLIFLCYIRDLNARFNRKIKELEAKQTVEIFDMRDKMRKNTRKSVDDVRAVKTLFDEISIKIKELEECVYFSITKEEARIMIKEAERKVSLKHCSLETSLEVLINEIKDNNLSELNNRVCTIETQIIELSKKSEKKEKVPNLFNKSSNNYGKINKSMLREFIDNIFETNIDRRYLEITNSDLLDKYKEQWGEDNIATKDMKHERRIDEKNIKECLLFLDIVGVSLKRRNDCRNCWCFNVHKHSQYKSNEKLDEVHIPIIQKVPQKELVSYVSSDDDDFDILPIRKRKNRITLTDDEVESEI